MTPAPRFTWRPEEAGYAVIIDRKTGARSRIRPSNQTEPMPMIINRLNSEGWR
jgi:hypothetical protein